MTDTQKFFCFLYIFFSLVFGFMFIITVILGEVNWIFLIVELLFQANARLMKIGGK